MDFLPLARPDIGELEQRYVQDALRSNRLAGGPWLQRFEQLMRDVCGVEFAVGVSSGTAALHLIVQALGIRPGDEVLTTPFSFIASSNCLLYVGARPRFVDIDPGTLNLDTTLLEGALTPHTRAVLAVDVFGQPADWPELARFCRTHDLHLIADSCEALGASIGGMPVGSWGEAAAFGFYPNKQITTGEGGCVTTGRSDIAAHCRSARNQGRATDDRMEHVVLGYNYRLDELSAALGCAQLERLPELLAGRSERALWYGEALAELQDDVVLPGAGPGKRSWFVYVVQLAPSFSRAHRDELLALLTNRGIGCAPYFPALHLQPYYRERFGYAPGAFPICESVSDRSLALPFFSGMRPEHVARVARELQEALARLRR